MWKSLDKYKMPKEVYVGIIESKRDGYYSIGHMWMSWGDRKPVNRKFRGYIPRLECIPPEILSDVQKLIDYLRNTPIPGVYIEDKEAMRIEISNSTHVLAHVKTKEIQLDNTRHKRLEEICFIPDGSSRVSEGTYSLDTTNPSYDNCVSWVGKKINTVRDGTIRITHPARIRDMYDEWDTRFN